MARRVTAIFDNRSDAERAADALADMGADRGHVSILARGDEMPAAGAPVAGMREHHEVAAPAREVGDTGAALTTTDEHEAAHDAGTGAAIGAAAGIAAGLAALMVPGFGLIMAAGPLAWAIGGAVGTAVAGAVVGGVYGGLRDIGIEEAHARHYEERIRGGGVLMTAIVPSMDEEPVRDVLNEYGAQDITFAEDASTMSGTFPAGEAALSNPAYAPTYAADRSMTVPPAVDTVNTPVMTAPPSSSTLDTAAMPSSGFPSTPTSPADRNIARGEAKQAEGEWRDRAADRTLNPLDDVAAKGEKVEGKLQEEYGEEEEVVETRRL